MPLHEEQCRLLDVDPAIFTQDEAIVNWLNEKWVCMSEAGPLYCLPTTCIRKSFSWGGTIKGIYLGAYPKEVFENIIHFELLMHMISAIQQDQYAGKNPQEPDMLGYKMYAPSQKDAVSGLCTYTIAQLEHIYTNDDIVRLSQERLHGIGKEFDALLNSGVQYGIGFINEEEANLTLSSDSHYLSFFVVEDE